jgi:UDP-N-acetylmuramate dehydrogenase
VISRTTAAPLAPLTTFGLGGPAGELWAIEQETELIDALRGLDRYLVLGGGSNVLVADEGVEGVVIAIRTGGISLQREGERVIVTAAAGEPWDRFSERCADEGLVGLECLGGIPGLVGATPVQNVGAYGQEVGDCLRSVRAYDRQERAVVEIDRAGCELSYRDSAFKSRWPGRFVVLSVTFELRAGLPDRPRYGELSVALAGLDSPSARDVRRTVIELRRRKGMVLDPADPDTRGAGSFFTNPVVDAAGWEAFRARVAPLLGPGEEPPSFDAGEGRRKLAAGWLIERAGFRKGTTRGGAGLSSRHALALVSRGGTAADVIALAREIQRGVRDRLGVWLTPEPVLLGFAGDPLGREEG